MAANIDNDNSLIDIGSSGGGNLGWLVRTNFCCYPCYEVLPNGRVITDCPNNSFNS